VKVQLWDVTLDQLREPMTLGRAARLLSQAGGMPVRAGTLREHVARGAPLGADGRMDVVAYAAWLVRKVDAGEE